MAGLFSGMFGNHKQPEPWYAGIAGGDQVANPGAYAQPQMPGLSTADKLGAIGAILQQYAGNPAGTATLNDLRGRQQDARQFQLAQQLRAQQQDDAWTQFQREQQWKLDHPAPVNNDTVNDYSFILKTLGPGAANQYLNNVAAGPPMAVDSHDPVTGNTVRSFVPRAQLPGMNAPASKPGAIIQQLPPGAKPIGGASPTGSQTFP